MPSWLGTTIVFVLIGAIIGAILFSHIRARKQGKSGCGCGCEHCVRACRQKQEAGKDEE